MKTVYNKETRNEFGTFYRSGDWSYEVSDDFSKPGFTETVPPDASIRHGIPCDWDEETQLWVLEPTTYASWRSGEWEALMHEHIFSRWGVPSQTSLLAHHAKAVKNERSDIETAIDGVWTWIQGCVVYWRGKVAELESAQDPTSVTWDIETACPEPEGGLPRLSDIEAMWSE